MISKSVTKITKVTITITIIIEILQPNLNYRNQTMDVSRLYLWIPSAALFPLTAIDMNKATLELYSARDLVDKNPCGER